MQRHVKEVSSSVRSAALGHNPIQNKYYLCLCIYFESMYFGRKAVEI